MKKTPTTLATVSTVAEANMTRSPVQWDLYREKTMAQMCGNHYFKEWPDHYCYGRAYYGRTLPDVRR